MKVISILSLKGGTGKTLLAQALYLGLKAKGYKVLGIDTDTQHNFTDSILKDSIPSFTLNDLIMETKPISKIKDNDFIASSLKLSYINLSTIKNDIFINLFKELKGYYDYVIIDYSPSFNNLSVCGLSASNGLIIPSECDIYNIKGVKSLLEIVKTNNPKLNIMGILLTRYNPRTIITKSLKDLLNNLVKEYKTQIYKTTIRECITIKEIRALQENLLTYGGGKSNAQKDYKSFIKEFLSNENKKK